MTELPAYPTDAAICRLLAGGPLPTAAIVDRLAMPDRTVRYRLAQLRRAEVVVTGPDKLHRLVAGPLPALVAGPLPALVAGPLPALVAGPLPANDDSDGELAASGRTPATSGSVVVRVAVVALAVGCVGVVLWVARHSAPGQAPARVAPPPNPAWPSGLGWSGPGSW